MSIEIKSEDGMVPLVIDGKSVLIDPFELEEKMLAMNQTSNGHMPVNAELLTSFNAYLATLGLPPVKFRGMGQILVKCQEVIEEFKKKDGWVDSTTTTPNSVDITDFPSSTSPREGSPS